MSSGWCAPPEVLTLSDGSVHVWLADLQRIPNPRELTETLSPAEIQRADAFLSNEARKEFSLTRGILRHVLGAYRGLPPASVQLSAGEKQKPYVPDGSIRFNVSHSHGYALFGFAPKAEVGVDIEHLDPAALKYDASGLVFTASELELVRNSEPPRRSAVFFNIWTRKEAFVKCLGEGLHRDLTGIEVGPEFDSVTLEGTTVCSLPAPAGYAAAIAVAATSIQKLSLWLWN